MARMRARAAPQMRRIFPFAKITKRLNEGDKQMPAIQLEELSNFGERRFSRRFAGWTEALHERTCARPKCTLGRRRHAQPVIEIGTTATMT